MIKRFNYNRTKFFKAIALLHEYQVGDEFYTLRDNKVIPVTLYQVEFTCYDHGLTHSCIRDLSIKIELICIYGGSSKMTIAPANLFRTREQAAEAFLDMNEIPKKLLQVLKPEKTNTTVAELVKKLLVVNQDTDLKDDFQEIINKVNRNYLEQIGVGDLVFCSEGTPVQIVKADQKVNSGTSPKVQLEVESVTVSPETCNVGIGSAVHSIETEKMLKYWRCSCPVNYVHFASHTQCNKCLTTKENGGYISLEDAAKILKKEITTSEYWDCECPENYIHPASHTRCNICKAHKEDCPDSRVDEVNKMLEARGEETI